MRTWQTSCGSCGMRGLFRMRWRHGRGVYWQCAWGRHQGNKDEKNLHSAYTDRSPATDIRQAGKLLEKLVAGRATSSIRGAVKGSAGCVVERLLTPKAVIQMHLIPEFRTAAIGQ